MGVKDYQFSLLSAPWPGLGIKAPSLGVNKSHSISCPCFSAPWPGLGIKVPSLSL